MSNSTVPSTEVRTKLKKLLDEVDETKTRVIITKKGRAKAAIVSIDELEGWDETLDILADKKDFDGSILAFQSRVVNFPETALRDKAYYQLGILYFKKGNFELACDQFDRVIRDFPQSDLRQSAMLQKGNSLYNASKYSKAIRFVVPTMS